jgi:lysophospholipase L1-like esterase
MERLPPSRIKLALLKLGLGPVLLAQGRRARARTPRLPEPAGRHAGCAGSGPPLRLLLVGDSSGAGVGVASQEQALLGQLLEGLTPHFAVTYRLVAKNGLTTEQLARRLDDEMAEEFDVAITAVGVNDVTAGLDEPTCIGHHRQLHELLRNKFSVAHILVTGLPPVHAFPALPQPLRFYLGGVALHHDFRLEAAVAKDENVHYIGLRDFSADTVMASDGFHPSAQIYRIWAAKLCQRIRQIHASRLSG